MLRVSAARMTRKSIAVAIILVFVGLAPAAAIIGFCARKPCCSHSPAVAKMLSTDRAGCCTTVTCYNSAPAKPAQPISVTTEFLAAPTLVAVSSVYATNSIVSPSAADTSPPITMRNRLAILSTLLV